MGSIIQMYASATPANAVAQVDVPMDGMILGVEWSLWLPTDPAGDFAVQAQLSFGSTGVFASNDARQVLSNAVLSGGLTTSGAQQTSLHQLSPLPELPVGAGERLYIHTNGSAVTINLFANVHFDFDINPRPVRRR